MKKIIVVWSNSKQRLSSTFLRFEENYESPKFKDSVFTHKEFKDWYVKEFDEWNYSDYEAFNVSKNYFSPFRRGLFNPLTKNEKKLLKILEPHEDDIYYVVGVIKGHYSDLRHELSHAFWNLFPSYSKMCLCNLKNTRLFNARHRISQYGNYDKKVMMDEIVAYIVGGWEEKWLNDYYAPEKKKLTVLFDKILHKNGSIIWEENI
jgi:hypothetical protein